MATIVLGVISLLKGIRHPGTWPATQALLNYDHGLIKRGLFGATFGKAFHLDHYVNFTILSYLLLYVLLRLLISLTIRSGVVDRLGRGEIAALFYSSVVISFLGVLAGYLDIVLASLTLFLLLIRDPQKRLFTAIPVCTAAIFVHEMFLIVFLPLILFSLVLDADAMGNLKQRKLQYRLAGLLAIGCTGLAWILSSVCVVSASVSRELMNEASKHADFKVDPNVYDALIRTATKNFSDMVRSYTQDSEWRMEFIVSILIFTPLTVMLVRTIGQMLEGHQGMASRKRLFALSLCVMFAPLLLNALGSDCARWDAMVCLDGFIVLMLLCRSMPDRRLDLSVGARNLIVLLVAINMATGEFMMGMVPNAPGANPYPFSGAFTQFVNDVEHQNWVPPK
ncbi:MAG: hypothetical protein P4L46_24590 [Fimbriimonas sp.]|nr:hypothetical protein [Fimbriimonas sp.]